MKLLIADDELLIRQGLSSLAWQELGITQVFVAANGIEAKDILEQEDIDIFLSDIRMPGLDGLQLAEMVYEKGWKVKIILLTGFSDFEYAKRAIKAHIHDYILKPLSTEELMKTTKAAIDLIKREKYEAQIVQDFESDYDKDTLVGRAVLSMEISNAQAQDMIRYICEHAHENLTLHVLSEQYHLSPVYLSRYIRKETGYSFIDILICFRLMNAGRLIRETNLKIQDIADQTGFKDQRYFSQIFRRLYGMKPMEYRKQKRIYDKLMLRQLLEKKITLET